MGRSFGGVARAEMALCRNVLGREPYNQYVASYGTSKLAAMAGDPDFSLREGETLEDLCILVSLRREPPKEIHFPEEYKGVRIAYRIVGDYEAAKKDK